MLEPVHRWRHADALLVMGRVNVATLFGTGFRHTLPAVQRKRVCTIELASIELQVRLSMVRGGI
eukprot:jgi/Botrbrau1/4429/Bobra.0348s0018.1